MKIGIVGHGFVGKAVYNGFNCDKFIVDPKNNTTLSDLEKFNPEFAFVCVPTPQSMDGSIDSSILEVVVEEISKFEKPPIVVIKSTVTPDVLRRLSHIVDLVYNPEFLTERNADKDFIFPHAVILGGNSKLTALVEDLYRNHSKVHNETSYVHMRIVDSVFVKYATNIFLASKVMFFNQLKEAYDKSGGNDWDQLIDTLGIDSRIGKSHMKVPGLDGRPGFGGACFPKDTTAFLAYSNSIGVNMSILKEVVRSNANIRSKYEASEREKEQNIKFLPS
jgi:UDPglucose 6-dehydrogenase